MIDAAAIGLRALSYLGALQAVGLFVFMTAFRDGIADALPAIRSVARVTVIVALAAVLAEQTVQPARLAGAWSGLGNFTLHRLWLESDAGSAAVARFFGLALLGGGIVNPSRLGTLTGAFGAAAIVGSFALMGHTAAYEPRLILAGLLSIHVGVVAFWLGALPALHLASRRDPAALAGRLVDRFSRAASALVPLILLVGLWMAVYLLPDLAALRTSYGLSLAAKVGGFTALIGIAALNKWRFGPRIASGSPVAGTAFRRGVVLEWVLIAAILVVTATMTTLFSPG